MHVRDAEYITPREYLDRLPLRLSIADVRIGDTLAFLYKPDVTKFVKAETRIEGSVVDTASGLTFVSSRICLDGVQHVINTRVDSENFAVDSKNYRYGFFDGNWSDFGVFSDACIAKFLDQQLLLTTS